MRKSIEALLPEQNSFVELSGLDDTQFDTWDVFQKPVFDPKIIDPYDAIMIGGFSDDPSDRVELPIAEFPFVPSIYSLIKYAIAVKKPSLLSCGGFMLASMALGAQIGIDPQKSELGVYPIYVTEEGRRDKLFGQLPPTFQAVSGHIKSTITLPVGSALLAHSDRCPVHAFKMAQAPFYACQFHPEISCEQLEARVRTYKHKYFENELAYRQFIQLLEDTSDANSLIQRFVEMV